MRPAHVGDALAAELEVVGPKAGATVESLLTLADDAQAHEVGPGVALFLPDGWAGRWEIRETVRKTFAIVTTR